jgi:hypothetical protein
MTDDALLDFAHRALTRGDPLDALRCVALREDAMSLALRGVAMAQLGELVRARELLRAAARAFGPSQALARARCTIAEAEIALATRDVSFSQRALQSALRTLESHGDTVNALQARLLTIRRLVLFGRVSEAEQALRSLDLRRAPSMHATVAALIEADIALRGLSTRRAQAALTRARNAARRSGIPALQREVELCARALQLPAARVIRRGRSEPVTLVEVERCLSLPRLIVDACRHCVRSGSERVELRRRPILLALLRTLAESWPESVTRDRLVASVFGVTRVNESHRVRLRVEIGRLRRLLSGLANVRAVPHGFELQANDVLVLAPPIEGADAALLALLADGAAWSSSALALALGASQRSVQRAVSALERRGEVHSFGRARARRWLTRPRNDFATALLLPAPRTIE